MATAADIRAVRNNTDEQNTETFSDEEISALIDSGGVDAASGAVWRRKAAAYSELVTQSEAGASVQFSDLFKNATTMATAFEARAAAASPDTSNSARVGKIRRTS